MLGNARFLFVAVSIAVLATTRVSAQDPTKTGDPNPTYQPGTMTPPPAPRIDDYSYTSIPGGANIPGLTRYFARLKALGIDDRVPGPPPFVPIPRFLLGYGLMVRASESVDIGVPDLFLSTRDGFDFGFTPYLSGTEGYSASIRADVSGALKGLQRELEARERYVGLLYAAESVPKQDEDETDQEYALRKWGRRFAATVDSSVAFNRLQFAPRVGISTGFREFEGDGDAFSIGVTYSRMYPLARRPTPQIVSSQEEHEDISDLFTQPEVEYRRFVERAAPRQGIQFSASATAIKLNGRDLDPRRHDSAHEFSLRVMWIDQVPWIVPDGVYRPRWQIGLEFTPDHALAKSDAFGIVVKRRFEPYTKGRKYTYPDGGADVAGKEYDRLIRRSVDLTLGVGIGRDSEPYVMFRLGKAFAF